jgi:hypothetical protein
VIWICPAKYQSVIHKQKMGDVKPINIPRPHKKA